MKCLLVGDIHLGPPPSIRTDTYAQDILDKLTFCMEYANEHADVVVLLGDVFNLKNPSRTSHALVQATANVLGLFKGRVLIVPGNHDLSNDRLESLPRQPLGTLALAANVELIDGYDDATGIYGIPYLDDFDEFSSRLAIANNLDVSLIVTHASIFPPGVHPPYEHMNADTIYTDQVPLAYGHIHDPHGFYEVVEDTQDGYINTWFCNNGAISRGSLHEETLKREPKVTLFDTSLYDCPFISVDVPHKPASEVFRLEERMAQQDTEKRLDGFLGTLEGTSLTSLSIEEVLRNAREAGLGTKAQQELEDIIELAQSS